MTKGGNYKNTKLTGGDVLTLTTCIEQAQYGFSQAANALDTLVDLLKTLDVDQNFKVICKKGCIEEEKEDEK